MADIRVERRRSSYTWLWIALAAIVVIVVAVVLLDYAGYIDLPFRIGAVPAHSTELVQAAPAPLQEA
jgi:hypothetical protein